MLTPDHELEFMTLTDFSVVPLARAAPLAARVAGDYGLDPLPSRDLERLQVEAQALARVVGILWIAGPSTATAPRCVIADPAHERFGEVLPVALAVDAERFVARAAIGLAEVGVGSVDWVFAVCIVEADAEDWRRERQAGPGRDHHVLPVSRVRRGAKRLSLNAALEQFRPKAPADWPFRGPKAIVEFLDGIDATGLELAGYCGHWQRRSGIHSQSGAAAEFNNLLELLRHLIVHDQVEVSNLAGAEFAARRCLQIQRAVRRSPRHPNFDGLDAMLSSALDETGGVVTSRFDAFAAAEQKDAAAILKHGEREADRERQGEQSRGSDDPGPGKTGGTKLGACRRRASASALGRPRKVLRAAGAGGRQLRRLQRQCSRCVARPTVSMRIDRPQRCVTREPSRGKASAESRAARWVIASRP